MVSLFLTTNRFHTFVWCFHCRLWTSKCRQGRDKQLFTGVLQNSFSEKIHKNNSKTPAIETFFNEVVCLGLLKIWFTPKYFVVVFQNSFSTVNAITSFKEHLKVVSTIFYISPKESLFSQKAIFSLSRHSDFCNFFFLSNGLRF